MYQKLWQFYFRLIIGEKVFKNSNLQLAEKIKRKQEGGKEGRTRGKQCRPIIPAVSETSFVEDGNTV